MKLRTRVYALLRWSERYIQTDMVYLTSSGFWLNLNVFIISVLAFLLSIAFANLLPAEVYGTYQYFLSFSTIVGALTLTGMNYAVTTAVAAGRKGVIRDAISVQLRWAVIPFLASIGIGAYYAAAGNYAFALGLSVIGVLIPAITIFGTYSAYLNGLKRFKQGFIYASIVNLAYYGAIFSGVLILDNAIALLIINLGVNALALGFVFFRTLRKFPPTDSIDPDAIKYGKHLSAMNVFSVGVRQLDSILVFQFLGPATLAMYTFATAVPERVSGLFKFLFYASLPKFATQSRSAVQRGLGAKFFKTTLFASLIAGLYCLAAPTIFSLLFTQYVTAVPYTQLYALVIVAGATNLSLSALIAQRMKRRLYIVNIASPAVQLTLQVALLVLYGLWGLLIARMLSAAFEAMLSLLLASLPERNRLSTN